MKISYAITVCNEFIEIQRLINLLLKYKRYQDEIVVLYDTTNGDLEIENYLRTHSVNGQFNWHSDQFNRDFAAWKNKLNSLCKGDYIFQIDADEYPCDALIQDLPELLELNPTIELFAVPRINTVKGLTEEHRRKWGWSINSKGWVNYPDYQTRIIKNLPEIHWVNRVHERLVGAKVIAALPEGYELIHPKTIDRQEKQNDFYDTLS